MTLTDLTTVVTTLFGDAVVGIVVIGAVGVGMAGRFATMIIKAGR